MTPIVVGHECYFCWWGDPIATNPKWRGGGYLGWHIGHDGAPLAPCQKIIAKIRSGDRLDRLLEEREDDKEDG